MVAFLDGLRSGTLTSYYSAVVSRMKRFAGKEVLGRWSVEGGPQQRPSSCCLLDFRGPMVAGALFFGGHCQRR